MKKTLTNLVLGAFVMMFLPYIIDGVYVKNFFVAVLVALVLSILNTFVKPIIKLLAFPVTLMTLGLFNLFINAFILMMVQFVLAPDFVIQGFFTTMLCSIVISVMYCLLGIDK